MTTTPEWNALRDTWPNAAASRFLDAGHLRWHVQVLGNGPAILLLHGAGAASHSWGDVARQLADRYTVVVPDLPGHGFTARPLDDRLSLDDMAIAVDALLTTLGLAPIIVAGHSAGGAIALRLATIRPAIAIVGINAAFAPPRTLPSLLAPLMRGLAVTRLFGTIASSLAQSDLAFRALMSSTGSAVSNAQYARYAAFARSPEHADALMTMFSSWDTRALMASLPGITTSVTLVVGARDEWVSPAESRRVAAMLRGARVIEIPKAGHLVHEEFPQHIADIIDDVARGASRTSTPGQRTG